MRQLGHDSIVAEAAGYSTLNLPIHDIFGRESRPVIAIDLLQTGAPRITTIAAPKVGDYLNFITALTLALIYINYLKLELHRFFKILTFFASQVNISSMEKGKVIFELSLQRQRSISPLGHKSHTALKV